MPYLVWNLKPRSTVTVNPHHTACCALIAAWCTLPEDIIQILKETERWRSVCGHPIRKPFTPDEISPVDIPSREQVTQRVDVEWPVFLTVPSVKPLRTRVGRHMNLTRDRDAELPALSIPIFTLWPSAS